MIQIRLENKKKGSSIIAVFKDDSDGLPFVKEQMKINMFDEKPKHRWASEMINIDKLNDLCECVQYLSRDFCITRESCALHLTYNFCHD